MSRTIQKIALTTLVFSLAGGAAFAQQIAPADSSELLVPYDEVSVPVAPEIIFSNLDRTPDNRYNSDPFDAFPVAGKSAGGETEVWDAIAFIPRVDVRAKVLLAAIGYISGTKLVNLGIYSDNDVTGSVGTLLPGGQGSTTQMPDLGDCCQLAKVTLPGEGVALTAGIRYWLVASPDNVSAPTFSGAWQMSNRAASAYLNPPFPWNPQPGQWPAAQIRGTKVQALGPPKAARREAPSPDVSAPAASVTIFTNLGPTSTDLYGAGAGIYVAGKSAFDTSEVWQALPFTAKANSHAKTLAAAVGYVSGTKKVNLGIYGDNGGTVGTLLPGGEGGTTEIPDFGDCCGLAKVTLPGAGVALTAGTQYWLVTRPDNVNAPTFEGLWQPSNLAVSAYQEPENFTNWTSFSAVWLAAEIRGTNP